MIRYVDDLYPADDPRDGARILRFTKHQKAHYEAVRNGAGTGKITLRGTTSDAQAIDPAGLQYVRKRRINTDIVDGSTLSGFDELVVGGYWFEEGDFLALDRKRLKTLSFGGTGTLAYLDREIMWSHTYLDELGFSGTMDPFDRIWRLWNQGDWAGGDFLGAILWRVISEGLAYRTGATYTHRHATPDAFGIEFTDAHDDDKLETAIPFVTLGFDQFEDSSGNAWTVGSGEFEAQVGDSLYEVTKRLMEAGLYVELDPDTFELRAWEVANHGRDRTGLAWGANVVRFNPPAAPSTLRSAGNILNDLKRALRPFIKVSSVLAGGGEDTYAVATASATVPWHRFRALDINDTDALQSAADRDITRRNDAGDTVLVRSKVAPDPANGYYLPEEHAKLDDLVTVHSGTDTWDWDEAAYPIAKWSVTSRRTGAPDVFYHLGASYHAGASKEFAGGSGVGRHTHPPNPELCRPGLATDTATAITRLYPSSFLTNNDPYTDYPSSVTEDSAWDVGGSGSGWDLVLVDTVPSSGNDERTSQAEGAVGGLNCFYGSYYRKLSGSGTIEGYFRGFLLCDAPSGIGIDDGAQDMVSQVIVRVYRAGTGIIGTPYAGHSLADSSAGGKWRTTGFRNQAFPPMSEWDDASLGVALTPVNYQDGDFLIIEVGSRNFTPAAKNSGGSMRFTADKSTDLPENETETSQLNSWFAITLPGESSFATTADGNLHLIGSGRRAKRCSDTEHYHTDRDPTEEDDWATGGWRSKTLWINEVSGATFYLRDADAGDWIQITSGPAHTHSAEETSFDNDSSGNASETVQGAIDRFHPVEAEVDPTSADDEYQVGTVWVNTTDGGKFVLVDDTPTAAVWDELGAGGSLAVAETDGAPDVSGVSRIEFDGATVTDDGSGQVTVSGLKGDTGSGSTVTVEEEDGAPSVLADTIKFPNGSVIDNADGSVSIAVASGGVEPWMIVPIAGGAHVSVQSFGSSNRGVLIPVIVPVDLEVDGIGTRVTVSSGLVSFAIYDESFNQLVTTGAIACPAVGHRKVSITPTALAAGRYWIGMSTNNTSFRVSDAGNGSITPHPMGALYADSSHPLPATFVPLGRISVAPNLVAYVTGRNPWNDS